MAGDARVILVHGTWGRKSKWFNPSGIISTALSSSIGLKEDRIERFLWRGGNSYRDRLRGSRALAARLHQCSEEKVVIVAHSHGGNVARSAVAMMDDRSPVVGIITIGTPFLIARPESDHLARYAPRAAIVFFLGCVIVYAMVGLHLLSYGWLWTATSVLVGLGIWALVSILTWVLGRRTAAQFREDLGMLLSPSGGALTGARLVIIGTPADEAAMFMNVLQFIGFLASAARGLAQDLPSLSKFIILLIAFPTGISIVSSAGEPPKVWFRFSLVPISLLLIAIPLLLAMIMDAIDRFTGGWDGGCISGRRSQDGTVLRVLAAPAPLGDYSYSMYTIDSRAGKLAHTGLTGSASVAEKVESATREMLGLKT